MYYPHLEEDKYVDEVEAYYANFLEWLWYDEQECSSIIYNAWLYDLMKYATLKCVDHPYPVDNHYFRGLFEEAYYNYGTAHVGDDIEKKEKTWYYNEDHDCFDKLHYIPEHPGSIAIRGGNPGQFRAGRDGIRIGNLRAFPSGYPIEIQWNDPY